MASSKTRRSSCSFINLLLSLSNFIFFILSAASLAPIITLKMPPTSLGYAFLMVSSISILSSFIGFYSQLTHFCYITHVSLLLASLIGQLLGFLVLFTKERSSLLMLKSQGDPREAKFLVRLECVILMGMFMMQLVILVMSCCVHSFWKRDYDSLDIERELTDMKRREKIAKSQQDSMENMAKMDGCKAIELNEEMKKKYGYMEKN